MLDETLGRLEAKIRQANTMNTDNKAEIFQLLGTLKAELAALAATHAEHATSITGFTEVSAHEATRQERNTHALSHAIDGLKSSVAELEVSHPRLVEVVNAFSTLLANIGV